MDLEELKKHPLFVMLLYDELLREEILRAYPQLSEDHWDMRIDPDDDKVVE